jgi:hypothetical protein
MASLINISRPLNPFRFTIECWEMLPVPPPHLQTRSLDANPNILQMADELVSDHITYFIL